MQEPGKVRIRGPRVLLRPLRPAEIEEEWRAMVAAGPMAVVQLPDEAAFKARLRQSGQFSDGWLDLAIDVEGRSAGRIQTYVPVFRTLAPGTFEIGIGLRERAQGRGYGTEALTLLTRWLFEHAAAGAVQAPTAPENAPMRAVFRRCGWQPAGPVTEYGREWILYRVARQQWPAR